MTTTKLARLGAVLFAAWGLLHVAGGLAIFQDGYAAYRGGAAQHAPIADAILMYLAYMFIVVGLAVTAVGATLGWNNSHLGLAINTALIGLTDLGLVVFLVVPGFVSWGEAAIGLGLFAFAIVPATIACRNAPNLA
jgi:hypothetical protein